MLQSASPSEHTVPFNAHNPSVTPGATLDKGFLRARIQCLGGRRFESRKTVQGFHRQFASYRISRGYPAPKFFP